MAESSPNGYKTLWENEKLFVTSNSSISHSIFKRLVLQTRKNQGLLGKGLNLYHATPTINDPMKESICKHENKVGKGENAGHLHFLFFPSCFLPNF